jgi:hypothetical protein
MDHYPNETRHLRLSDIVVLIAAAALMFSSPHAAEWLWARRNPGTVYGPGIVKAMTEVLALTAPSLVLLPYQLMRSSDRRRLRQGTPGLCAHLAIVTVLGVQITGWAAQALTFLAVRGTAGFHSIRWAQEAIGFLLGDLRDHMAIAVTATWLLLVGVDRWNPERSWDDRLGRLLGCCWVLFYLCTPLLALLG